MMQGRCRLFCWKYEIAMLVSVRCSKDSQIASLVDRFCEVVSCLNSSFAPAFSMPFHIENEYVLAYYIFSLEETCIPLNLFLELCCCVSEENSCFLMWFCHPLSYSHF